MRKLKFRAFRAIDEPMTCEKYLEGHINVLKDYNITNITSNNQAWMRNPNIYCVVASWEDSDELVGGIRVQISDEDNYLPVETAIGKMDPKIHEIVSQFRIDGGVGELCGLWNAKKVAGMGISVLLTRAGISITNQLDFKTMVGICADYTLVMFSKVGFVVDNSLGNNGEFPYPNPSYTARVLGIMNAETLDTADPYDRERMSTLRENPVQSRLEIGGKDATELIIDYDLILKNNA